VILVDIWLEQVLCPLDSFLCPDHFSFSRRISSRQPQQPRRTQPFRGLLQLNARADFGQHLSLTIVS
jgi:hypothetical protein